MKKPDSAKEIQLVSFDVFKQKAKSILDESKKKSDKKMVLLQAANVKKREARKKRKIKI